MNKNLIPNLYYNSVFDIDLDMLKEKHIKGIFFDIDNTLAPFGTDTPSPEACAFFDKIKSFGFKIAVISNAGSGRSRRYAEKADLYFTGRAHKPSVKGFQRTFLALDLLPCETVMVGDQIFTDIKGGNKSGTFTILVKPVDLKSEPWYTKIKRGPEKRILKKCGISFGEV